MAKEYIEREALKEEILNGKNKPTIYNGSQEAEWICECISNAPAADVQEVRHGNEFKCPFCDYSYFTDDMEYNFCPNCGAKMDAGMTNFEKIKQMSVEELAEYILDEFRIDCAQCECRFDYNGCRYCIKHHFESEAEE